MSQKLGARKFKLYYGEKYPNRAAFMESFGWLAKGYLWHVSMARSGLDFCGERYIEYKPGSAKHRLAIKLELYEDRALGLMYSDKAWQGNHRKNEITPRHNKRK